MRWTYGIDISKWQGAWVDPELTLSSGISFVYMRGANGYRKDNRVDEYAFICRQLGIDFGLYTYFRPGKDPVEQAQFLFRLHKELGATLVPQLDIEHSDDMDPVMITDRVVVFVEEVERLFGVPASIYSAAWWWNPNIVAGRLDMSDRTKWVARYVSMSSGPAVASSSWREWADKFDKPPRLPRGWDDWDLWQFSADGNNMGRALGFSSSHLDLNIAKPGVVERLRIGVLPEPERVLGRGSRGEQVRDLQRLLTAVGYSPGPIDGIFGPITEGALRRFEQASGLAVDGVAAEADFEALRVASEAPDDSGLAEAKLVVLRRGSRGAEVVVLQTLLRAGGYYLAKIDGSFGPVTEQAVRLFQKANNLVVDGWVGPQTWGVL